MIKYQKDVRKGEPALKSKWPLLLALAATALWLWFIYARSAKPAEVSHLESEGVLELLLHLFPFLTLRAVRKLAHFAEYFLLGGLLYLDWSLLGRPSLLLSAGAGLAAAAGDEFLQTFVPGRSGELGDVLLDLSGVIVGAGAVLLLRKWKEAKGRGA